MIRDQISGLFSKIKNASEKLNKQSNTPVQQDNSSNQAAINAQINEINAKIDLLNNELVELEKKKKLCQNIIARIDSAIGKINNISGSFTEITGNLDNSLKVTNISQADIDSVKGAINNDATLLNSSKSVLTEKCEEIQRAIIEKQNSLDSLNRTKNSLL